MKRTPEQKRSGSAYGLDKLDIGGILDANQIPERSQRQLHCVQLSLADMALGTEDPQKWLSEVLGALSLKRVMRVPVEGDTGFCGQYSGTSRGLNLHLHKYDVPCGPCAEVRIAQRRARLENLGITHDGVAT